jgi:RNA polymerase sigma-70 factor (ECF subfamily)
VGRVEIHLNFYKDFVSSLHSNNHRFAGPDFFMTENNNSTEIELIERAKAGDKKALSKIVKDNEQLVFNSALRLVGNTEEAECVMQETFLKVFQALPTFKGESSLSTWIYRIATNFALMRLRDRKKEFNGFDDIDLKVSKTTMEAFNRSVGNNPHRAVENVELREQMEAAIEELPAKFKSVFVLKDIEGLSLKEIADMNDMSLPAVKSNLHRARLFLRNRLAEYAERESLAV